MNCRNLRGVIGDAAVDAIQADLERRINERVRSEIGCEIDLAAPESALDSTPVGQQVRRIVESEAAAIAERLSS